jgi:hypothetical protein
MKKNILKLMLTVAVLFGGNQIFAQNISRMFFGQNAWMPDSIGKTVYNGKLHQNWGNIAASGAGTIRFGGTAVENDIPSYHQYVKMVDSIRAKGMEPMLQVPFGNYKHSAAQAAAIVKHVNITKGKNVRYWVISNEPDLAFGFTNSSQVAAYLKAYSSAMKAVDPSIVIIGPECAWYNKGILHGLTTPGGPDDITGKDANGRYYLDIISFHTYPFKGTQNRDEVVANLNQTGAFEDNLTDLNARVQSCNSFHGRTGTSAVRVAVTEANIDYTNPGGDNIYGVGANSFIGGQFWAEFMGIAMKKGVMFLNFWSVIEGGNNGPTDIGFLQGQTAAKKPSYYHFQMMAQNFRGTYANSTDNHSNIKTYAVQDGKQVAVIILNQDQASSLNFTVRLNTASASGNSTLKVNVDAGINREYTDFISSQSTILLVFDFNGNLVKKIEYKLNGHADANTAPTVYNYGTVTDVNDNPKKDAKPMSSKVFPNPAKGGKFTIEANTSENTHMEVYNIAGQLVYRRDIAPQNGTINERIEMSPNIATGMYIVQLRSGSQVTNSKILLTK